MPGQERVYRFGNFTLAVNEHCLHRGSQEIHVRPKVFDTLLFLVERHGHLITKTELLNGIWSDVIVTENTLNKCIEEVRHVLNDSPQNPLFVQTISRVGFKFIGRVETSPPSNEHDANDPASLRAADVEKPEPATKQVVMKQGKIPYVTFFSVRLRRDIFGLVVGLAAVIIIAVGLELMHRESPVFDSIAVLPFVNLSGDRDQEYFADGMTEALIADLAKIPALKVISRTSVMLYKGTPKPLSEIASALNVSLVIEGSVFRDGNHVRIITQLIDARTDQHLWVGSYDRDVRDILLLQKDLSQAIAKEIHAELTAQEKTMSTPQVDPLAYEAYLKGRYFWNKRTSDGFRKGIQYFEQAIGRDSTYALAYVGLADCYNMLSNYDVLAPAEVHAKIVSAIAKALKINSNLAEAHASLAFAKMFYEWDSKGAEMILRRAIELNPNYADAHHWYGLCLAMQQRFDEARAEMKVAQTLDPLSIIINTNIGWVLYFARQYDQAVKQFQASLELDSAFVSAHVKLGWAYEELAMSDKALAEFKSGLRLLGDDPALQAILASGYAGAKMKSEALVIIDQLKDRTNRQYVTPYMTAVVYAGLGDNDQAFQWLQKAYRGRDGWLAWLQVDPKLDPLRDDPRFVKLMDHVALHLQTN
jgi:TolB-like protein/DNA-binding winged helix-turn-helix (wHTH) protein/predicted negative regulator of RcsB-dependent stress response